MDDKNRGEQIWELARVTQTNLNVPIVFIMTGEVIGPGVRFAVGMAMPEGNMLPAIKDLALALENTALELRKNMHEFAKNGSLAGTFKFNVGPGEGPKN